MGVIEQNVELKSDNLQNKMKKVESNVDDKLQLQNKVFESIKKENEKFKSIINFDVEELQKQIDQEKKEGVKVRRHLR